MDEENVCFEIKKNENLQKLHEEITAEELQILAFSNENPEKLRKFAKEYEINYKVASIQKALSVPFGPPYVKEVPSSFYIDKQGMIKLAKPIWLRLNSMVRTMKTCARRNG